MTTMVMVYLDLCLAEPHRLQDAVVALGELLSALSGADQKSFPARRAHPAFGAASKSRAVKRPFDRSGVGSLSRVV